MKNGTNLVILKKHLASILILCLAVFFVATSLTIITAKGDEQADTLICTQQDFYTAIDVANDGDEILVGDIEFTYKALQGKNIEKSLTIKSGKQGNAVFNYGAFALSGGASESKAINVKFENIDFVGVHDVKNTVYTYSNPDLSQILKTLSAVTIEKFVNATFNNCNFTNYRALSYGAIINVISSEHMINVTMQDCTLNENVAHAGGGAIYLSGNDNITLKMINCELDGNVSASSAIRAHGASVELYGVTVSNTKYIDTTEDVYGGAIYLGNCDAYIKDCIFTNNCGKNGGAVALKYTDCEFDGVIIKDNSATVRGGAIYSENNSNTNVYLINSTVTSNDATVSNGAIATYPSSNDLDGKITSYLCSYNNNSPRSTDANSRTAYVGCAIYGESDVEVTPSAQNDYNYYSPLPYGETDGHIHSEHTVSANVVKSFGAGRFSNAYGTFYIGSNFAPINVKIYENGEHVKNESSPYLQEINLTPNERAGYTFIEWQYEDGTPFVCSALPFTGAAGEPINVHAVYTPNVYTVTYDFGSGTQTVTQTYDQQITFPQPLAKEGYDFVGWYTQKNGDGSKINNGDLYKLAYDATYYAYYKKEFPITYLILGIALAIILAGVTFLVITVFRHNKRLSLATASQPPAIEPEPKKESVDVSALSTREKEVLHLLLQGKQRNEISKTLYISENTVKKQITSIYQKLEVSSRAELFAKFNN